MDEKDKPSEPQYDFDPAEERRVLVRSLPWLAVTLVGGGLLMAGLKLRGQSLGTALMAAGVLLSIAGLAGLVVINASPPGTR